MVHAKDYFLLSFDNVSGMKGDLSDALCVLSTGGGFGARKLYSDGEMYVFNSSRPVIINGIAEFANRADLLDRSIVLHLPALTLSSRATETALLAKFDEMLPRILGCLYDIVAGAMSITRSVDFKTTIRMADCAQWLAAAERFTGLKPGTFEAALKRAQQEASIERVQTDGLYLTLTVLLKDHPFEGTVGELFDKISLYFDQYRKYFPQSPSQLSKALARLRPAALAVGLHIDFLAKSKAGKRLRIWRDGQEDMPAKEFILYKNI